MDTGRPLHGQSDVPILRWHQHHSVVLGAQTDRETRLPREGHGVAGEPAVPLQRLQEGLQGEEAGVARSRPRGHDRVFGGALIHVLLKRPFMLRDFGTAPFDVPIHVSCLLPHDATRRVFLPPQQQPQQPQLQPQPSTASRAVLTDQQPSTSTAAHGATIAGDDSDDGQQLRSQSQPDDQEYDFDPSTTSTAEGAAFLLAMCALWRTR